MKTISKSVLSVMLLFVLSITVSGQASGGGGGGSATTPIAATPAVQPPSVGDLPSTLPITSPEVLIANAKRMVSKVAVYVSSRGFVHGAPGTVTYFEKEYVSSVANQPDFGEFLAIVSTANFSFETRNPNDPIEVLVAFRDKDGRGLFQGSQSFKLVKNPNGSYAPPTAEIKVQVWPNGDLPLEIAGADWVEIALLNERGETSETRSLDRDQRTGNFLFPLWLTGQRNVLVTAFDNRDDGTTAKAVYSAQTGARQPTFTQSVSASATLEGVIVVKPDVNSVTVNRLDEQVARSFNNGVSPLVQIKFTKTLTLFFYAEHPIDGVAKGFWVRRSDQVGWAYFSIVQGTSSTVTMDAGIYDIIIDWATFGKRDQSFDGRAGGKG